MGKEVEQAVWEALVKAFQYQQGSKERYKVERKFGAGKQVHGLGHCRYIGKVKFDVQALFVAIMLNLKRLVRLLIGMGFKTQALA